MMTSVTCALSTVTQSRDGVVVTILPAGAVTSIKYVEYGLTPVKSPEKFPSDVIENTGAGFCLG